MNKDIVITGMGVVSPLGNEVNTLMDHLIAGKSGVSLIERFDTTKFSVKFAGEVKQFDPTPYFEPKEISRTSRNIQYMVHSAIKAVEQAGLKEGNFDKTRAGMILGSGIGGMEVFNNNSAVMAARGPGRISPFFIPQAIANMASGQVAIQLGWMGPNWATLSACATGNHSIMTACDQIRLGRADIMLAGGTEESVCESGVAGFSVMKALSTRNDNPEAASRPYDIDRDGFVLGEGSACLVLESEEHAKARGAKILGRILGYGASCDAYHISAPHPEGSGVALALEMALKESGLGKSDIGFINGHSTSTPLGDVAEIKAIKKVFGSHTQNIKMQATKSMTGHLLGAASAIEAVVTMECLSRGKLHPTLNLENQEPEIDMDCVAKVAQGTQANYAISNSFGFGGHNTCVVFAKA